LRLLLTVAAGNPTAIEAAIASGGGDPRDEMRFEHLRAGLGLGRAEGDDLHVDRDGCEAARTRAAADERRRRSAAPRRADGGAGGARRATGKARCASSPSLPNRPMQYSIFRPIAVRRGGLRRWLRVSHRSLWRGALGLARYLTLVAARAAAAVALDGPFADVDNLVARVLEKVVFF